MQGAEGNGGSGEIDEALIRALVHGFYAAVREDALVGPVFAARVGDWDEHLATMCDFWSGVALTTGRYKGRPMQKHVPLGLEQEHFTRWLELFEAAAARICPPEAASFFIGRARRIAESLQLGIAHASGVLRQQLQSATSKGETRHAA